VESECGFSIIGYCITPHLLHSRDTIHNGRGVVKGKIVSYLREDRKMIIYEEVNRGDILKIVGDGAPGYAEIGDLVRVVEHTMIGVKVEDKHGKACQFVFNCGAARLEETEWKDDFPE
jgi:hypothetical protein